MKLIYEKVMSGSEDGFAFKEIRARRFVCPWHFHTEHELILTLNCPGYRMVGDDITELEPGDLVLLGSNLPHIWQHDEGKPASRRPVHILLVQFEPNFLGGEFWRLPVTRGLRQLMSRAALGLRFTGRKRQQVGRLMGAMRGATGFRQLLLLLTILETLASSPEQQVIASPGYTGELSPFNQERIEFHENT
jgi:hypothetical protein